MAITPIIRVRDSIAEIAIKGEVLECTRRAELPDTALRRRCLPRGPSVPGFRHSDRRRSSRADRPVEVYALTAAKGIKLTPGDQAARGAWKLSVDGGLRTYTCQNRRWLNSLRGYAESRRGTWIIQWRI